MVFPMDVIDRGDGGYCRFLETLLSEGRALAASPASITADQLELGDAVLTGYERIWRRDLPEPMPEFNPDSARWAAVWLYRACQFAVYRDVDETAIHNALSGAFEAVATADVHYSVDLTFRFLPDLEKFARSAAEADPLLDHLKERATQWPLSSVGMSGIGPVAIDGFAKHPGLMQLYADRILATGDTSRLADERVRTQVESSLGIFTELAPRLAADCSKLRVGNAK